MNILHYLLILYNIAICCSLLIPITSGINKRKILDKINFTILKPTIETQTPKIIVKETMIPNNINNINDKNDNTTSVRINKNPKLPVHPDASLFEMLII